MKPTIYQEGLGTTILYCIDGLGVGSMPQSPYFGKNRLDTLEHTERMDRALNIPNLSRLGLSNMSTLRNHLRINLTEGFYAKSQHHTIHLNPLHFYYNMLSNVDDKQIKSSFQVVNIFEKTSGNIRLKEDRLNEFQSALDIKFLHVSESSLSEIIHKFQKEHISLKQPFLYVTPDETINIGADTTVISQVDLQTIAHQARYILDQWNVPYICTQSFTVNQQEYTINHLGMFSLPILEEVRTIVNDLYEGGIGLYNIGKLGSMFNQEYFLDNIYPVSLEETMKAFFHIQDAIKENEIKENIILMHAVNNFFYENHHDDRVEYYTQYLEKIDHMLPTIYRKMDVNDILIITSNLSADPTISEGYFSLEYIPILIYSKLFTPRTTGNLGNWKTTQNISQLLSDMYGIGKKFYKTESVWELISSQL